MALTAPMQVGKLLRRLVRLFCGERNVARARVRKYLFQADPLHAGLDVHFFGLLPFPKNRSSGMMAGLCTLGSRMSAALLRGDARTDGDREVIICIAALSREQARLSGSGSSSSS